jgi:hypothetical protein
VWEWCDLEHENLVQQTESNWHSYSEELSQSIEEASKQRNDLSFTIGLQTYVITGWTNNNYAIQLNSSTNVKRYIRKGRQIREPQKLDQSLVGEACGLCTELFENTREWTRRTTPCKHIFHSSCLQKALHFCNKCPLCRTSLQGISAVDLPH